MPREAKFSPAFHEVRPAKVPLHSFCQIFFPMRRVSAGERSIAAASPRVEAKRKSAASDRWLSASPGLRPRLTIRPLFISVAVPAAPRLRNLNSARFHHSYESSYHLPRRSARCFHWFSAGQTATKRSKRQGQLRHWPRYSATLSRSKMEIQYRCAPHGLEGCASAGKEPLLNEEQVKETMAALQKEMMEKQDGGQQGGGREKCGRG